MPSGVYDRQKAKIFSKFLKTLEAPYCACGCGEKVIMSRWHCLKVLNNIPVYLVGHIHKGKKRPDHSEALTGKHYRK